MGRWGYFSCSSSFCHWGNNTLVPVSVNLNYIMMNVTLWDFNFVSQYDSWLTPPLFLCFSFLWVLNARPLTILAVVCKTHVSCLLQHTFTNNQTNVFFKGFCVDKDIFEVYVYVKLVNDVWCRHGKETCRRDDITMAMRIMHRFRALTLNHYVCFRLCLDY